MPTAFNTTTSQFFVIQVYHMFWSKLRLPSTKKPAEANPAEFIQLRHVHKAYHTPAGLFYALRDINLTIAKGEFLGILGKSGAGKSTLINMIAGIDKPSSGEIFVNGEPIHTYNEGQIAAWRGQKVGVIFQFFQLMPMLSCLENVMLPMDFSNLYGSQSGRKARALELLEQVEIPEQAYKLPSAVSGGQQQRVAIARALANSPTILLADEPTGNLDTKTAEAIFKLFEKLVSQGMTIVVVTHDHDLAQRFSRTITMLDGVLEHDVLA